MAMTNEELRESLVKLWDAHSKLRNDYERHDSWAITRWDEYDKEMTKVDKSIRHLLGSVGTLNIITAVSKTKLGVMFIVSNAIGGAMSAVTIIAFKLLGGE